MVPVARGTVVDVVGGSFRTESSGGLVAALVMASLENIKQAKEVQLHVLYAYYNSGVQQGMSL